MSERAIVMSASEVRAVATGRKTQARHIIWPQPKLKCVDAIHVTRVDDGQRPPWVNRVHIPATWIDPLDRIGGSCEDDMSWWAEPEAEICPFGAGDVLTVVELRPVPRNHSYYAGSDGRIYSYSNANTNAKRPKPFALIGTVGSDGYERVTLTGEDRGSRAVHALVCAAFHGAPPTDRCVVRHLDGNRRNNHPENLVWGSYAENEADKRRHRTLAHGERQGNAKLTTEDVDLIRRSIATGLTTPSRAAEVYGIHPATVRNLAAGRGWRGLRDAPLPPLPSYRHLRIAVECVWVHRVQRISCDDAVAEGLERSDIIDSWRWSGPSGCGGAADPRAAFAALWRDVHGPASWADNLWVWAISFRHVEAQQLAAAGGAR